MKKLTSLFIILALLLTATATIIPTPARAEFRDMWADVYALTGYNADGSAILVRKTAGITYKVLAIDSDTAETLTAFDDKTFAAYTNPVTTTAFNVPDRIQFRVDPTDSGSDQYVDLIVTDTSGGYSAFVENFDAYQHSIVIDERPGIVQHGMIWFGASDNAATDTGVDFLPDTVIHDVVVEIVTVDNTETISIGTADTAAGFISALSLNTGTEGYKLDTGIITGGNTIDYVAATQYGTLLTTAITGSDVVATVGGNTRKRHYVVTAGTDDDLYYTGSAGSDTAAGYIHYFFTRLR